MTTVSAHVLDAALGLPATGLNLVLTTETGEQMAATTDGDGRVCFAGDHSGVCSISFATGPWFAAADRHTFFPSVHLAIEIDSAQPHQHVALLLSPYAYTTYRGS